MMSAGETFSLKEEEKADVEEGRGVGATFVIST